MLPELSGSFTHLFMLYAKQPLSETDIRHMEPRPQQPLQGNPSHSPALLKY